jgi:hypothetical protein
MGRIHIKEKRTMTTQELRNTKDYKEAMAKIEAYRKGFKFTIDYTQIPRAKGNALKIILRDAIKSGLLESVQIGLSLEGEQTDETFVRL